MMPIPDYDDAFAAAALDSPFSNGAEGEAWMDAWCGRCLHSDGDDGCTLTLVAIMGRTPAAWVEVEPGLPRARYFCRSWEPLDEVPL